MRSALRLAVASNQDLDRLYQLPLSEFTAARNALAKNAGKDGAAIKARPKPSVPAWAVNQLYWTDRRSYDRLIKASERVRAGHAQSLKGRKVDLAALELQHDAAIKQAADRVRDILARHGDPGTPATMKAVVDTLRSLPGGEPGRLSKTLAPMGFDALGALLKQGASPRALAEIVTFAPPRPKPDEAAAAARRAEEAAERRRTAIAADLKRLAAALTRARAAHDRAARVRAEIEGRLERAAAHADRCRAEVARLERETKTLESERARLIT
jgi:hypothetical protein